MSRTKLLREMDRVTAQDVRAVIDVFLESDPPKAEAIEIASYCLGVAKAAFGSRVQVPTSEPKEG